MANGTHRNLVESASFWLILAGVTLAGGVAAVAATAGKVGGQNVTAPVLAGFSGGCLLLLVSLGAGVWGLSLFVADRIVERRLGTSPAAPTAQPGGSSSTTSNAPAVSTTPEQPANSNTPNPSSRRTGPDELSESADDLIKIRRDHTELGAAKQLEPYIGKWLTVEAAVRKVEPSWAMGKDRLRMRLGQSGDWKAEAYFNKDWSDRLSTLRVGATVKVRGKVRSVDDTFGVELLDCEIVG